MRLRNRATKAHKEQLILYETSSLQKDLIRTKSRILPIEKTSCLLKLYGPRGTLRRTAGDSATCQNISASQQFLPSHSPVQSTQKSQTPRRFAAGAATAAGNFRTPIRHWIGDRFPKASENSRRSHISPRMTRLRAKKRRSPTA